jgi:KDO2-lipid IV(A) lauroyltransferase
LIKRTDSAWPEVIGTFRQTDAPVNSFLFHVRGRYSDRMLAVSDQRGVLRALRKKSAVWYAPDIEVRGKQTAMVDFMGVPASTTTAISRLAKATGAVVIPVGHDRIGDGFDYVCRFLPPLQDVPSDDLVRDTRALNAAFEQLISAYPMRYWWAIKRFKRRPEGAAKIY